MLTHTENAWPLDIIFGKMVDVLKEGRSRIVVCTAYRMSCEGWLKVELVRGLSEALLEAGDIQILPEEDRVDVVVQTSENRILVELKTFPTNYGDQESR